ncbi:type VI secretion system protein TssA [Variovorax sp. PAMC 28711]|uniref:type VI secretion system protein TssA n=1 Tax=Variovorax sp. PAMC 28711 TaxID=1795631 RepID=UPI00078E1744|nr:type VI secretion system protein TssA [Variovorax sp. PAMC 28711]AMM25120.1 type VI secretion protein ImpA [Variovorax sp. PAMC 28711]
MLTPELVQSLQAPISEASPCGDDLAYDPAFTALESASQGKPEQQFGDTVIPAIEPEWRAVAEQAEAVLRRAKDVRPAVLLLRAATRQQGVAGFDAGLRLLTGLLDTFWDGIHPTLDADDDNDPTMRLNALAPLTDEGMVLRDLYDAHVGTARGVGPIRVRDIAIAHHALAAGNGDPAYSAAQIQGALEEIHGDRPDAVQTLMHLRQAVGHLQALLRERTGLDDAVDFGKLRAIAAVLHKAASGVAGAAPADETTAPTAAEGSAGAVAPAPAATSRSDIQNRQDALQLLDRVIRYLEQTEPGNPAPLLIERAKKLIGVSFFEIMSNLAPGAIDSIETVTGRRPSE